MKVKTGVVAIFFILLMLISTFAFSLLQSVRVPSSGKVTLPERNIIDYELAADQESLALSRGMTVAKLYYYIGCMECNEQLSFLEYMARQFPDQIILEEIITNRTTSLSISSYYGQKNLVNATQEQMLKAFCDVMAKPPITCAVR